MTGMRRWPLCLIALPAAVAVWSGWVGLGQLAGFGLVHLLPGIAPRFELNSAITLPVGVEAYGAFALGAWLAPGSVPERARKFARRSAIGSLALGMAGQVVFHLLAAAHASRARWPVTILVACMPVVTLGFGVALAHLLRSEPAAEATQPAAPVPAPVPEPPPAGLNGTGHEALELFADELAAGTVPGVRRIREQMHLGAPRATQVRDFLADHAAASSNGHGS